MPPRRPQLELTGAKMAQMLSVVDAPHKNQITEQACRGDISTISGRGFNSPRLHSTGFAARLDQQQGSRHTPRALCVFTREIAVFS